MGKLIAAAAALIVVVGLAACGSGDSMSDSSSSSTSRADVVVTKSGYDKTQDLMLGQTMDVEVTAPTGTNYSWSVRDGLNTRVLTQDGDPVVTPTREGMPGAPAVTTFRFTAVGDGRTEVLIDLRDNATGESAESVRVPVSVTG